MTDVGVTIFLHYEASVSKGTGHYYCISHLPFYFKVDLGVNVLVRVN